MFGPFVFFGGGVTPIVLEIKNLFMYLFLIAWLYLS